MEQDFYMFAKKNFNSIKKRALPASGGALAPQQFRFEKIRPKYTNTMNRNTVNSHNINNNIINNNNNR